MEQKIFGMAALYCKKYDCVHLNLTSDHAAINVSDFVDFVAKLLGITAEVMNQQKRQLPCASEDCPDRDETCGIPPSMMFPPMNLS